MVSVEETMARRYARYEPALAGARAKSRTHNEKHAATMEELLPQISDNLFSSGGMNTMFDNGLLGVCSVDVLLEAEKTSGYNI